MSSIKISSENFDYEKASSPATKLELYFSIRLVGLVVGATRRYATCLLEDDTAGALNAMTDMQKYQDQLDAEMASLLVKSGEMDKS